MSIERDPELSRVLELGLESPIPRPGAERRIAERLAAPHTAARRRLSHWAFVCAALVACAALFVFVHRARQPSEPTLALSAPAVSWLSLKRARVALLGKATLGVERDDEHETEVRLTAGTALFHVQRGTGRRFVVRAGDSSVEVVGTVFGVALAGERAEVEVVEGVVRVREGDVARTLVAGQATPPGAHLFLLAPAELERLRAPIPTPPASTTALVQPSAPEPVPTRDQRAPHPGAAPEDSAGSARAPGPAHSAVSLRPPSGASASSAAAADDAYQQARALEREGALDQAARAYTAIVRAGGATADDAAFALVRLSAERGATAGVLSAVTAYRAAFPTGRYARDVDVLELNAHLARRDEAAAQKDAAAFVARYANDARAWRFHLVLAMSRARAGDCAGARNELESVPDGPEKASALANCAAP